MIQVEQAYKSFGKHAALNGVSLSLEEGQIVGLLGTNGAGKSTLLKAIAGLLPLDRGIVKLEGEPPSLATRAMLAYLPENDAWYPWMKISDAIRYMKDMYLDWNGEKSRIMLDFFGLKENTVIAKASKGTRAKIKLVLALSRHAKYVLLDEPFSGIDPLARQQIIEAILDDFMEEGQTIVMSTHEVTDVEKLLDRVLFMHEGKLLLQGHAETLRREHGKSLLALMKEAYPVAHV
ncbi:ABC transporter ATP-binding protein [Paenibacillus sp. MBLB4367]|uniref:ABC transporter ATP-binding protein n=1 Tax=Paenibacillus sp. MBLB4367 TaxID=3384767 RepID=UPI0039081576